MKRMRLKQVILAFSTLVLLSIITLGLHIYQVTHKHKTQLQLGRIDFKQNISVQEANKIQSYVRNMPGISNTHFNIEDGILVYTYMPNQQDSKNVFEKLVNYGHYHAVRYVTSAEEATKGCPAFANKEGIRGKIIAFIASL